jgi:hypothetical protein
MILAKQRNQILGCMVGLFLRNDKEKEKKGYRAKIQSQNEITQLKGRRDLSIGDKKYTNNRNHIFI